MAPASLIFLNLLLTAAASKIPVGDFSQGNLTAWKDKIFVGKTTYQIFEEKGLKVLKAESHAAASALIKEVRQNVDSKTKLAWSWKVSNVFTGNDEKTKAGDDYPARVYLIFKTGPFLWQTRALNYVWSSNQPQETIWRNAYTDKVAMIAVRSGSKDLGRWVTEGRNISDDYQRCFGESIQSVRAVALMTDADNTKQQAVAYYGDIYFE